FNPIGTTALNLTTTPSTVTVDGLSITGSATAVRVRGDSGGGATSALVQNNAQLVGGGSGTGVLVQGPQASATVQNNAASIHGFAIGIDVSGGSATITNNHIYANTTGI